MFFTDESPPDSVLAVMLWPGIFFIIAAAIAYAAHKVEWDGGKAKWKWATFLPLFLGLLVGFSAIKLVTGTNYDQLNYSYNMGRKVTYALWGSFALPILGMIAYGAYQFWLRNQRVRY